MASDPGFLARLLGSNEDESAVASALLNQQKQEARGMFAQFASLGQQANPLVGGAAGAVGGLISGNRGRGLSGLKQNFAEGFQKQQDFRNSQILGIAPETIAARRETRRQLNSANFVDDGTHDARIKMARRAAEIANRIGDTTGLARALQVIDELETEKLEFQKLSHEVTGGGLPKTSNIKTGFDSKAHPTTGILTIENGQSGLRTNQGFRPFDENFSLSDPGKQEPLDVRLNRIFDIKQFKNLAVSANAALNRTDRILGSLVDLSPDGRVTTIIGTPGKILTRVDNFLRTMDSVVQSFTPTREGAAKDKQFREELKNKTTLQGTDDQGNPQAFKVSDLIPLPQGVAEGSAAAQQHIADIMEMAYMAARMAEPSNRGLSDNDIKNALIRIAGGTANPQVIMRRFIQMQIDAANDLDFQLSLVHGSLGPNVSDEQIDIILGGKGIKNYRTRKDSVFKKYGVTSITEDGRATFSAGSLLGDDVQPGETITDATNREATPPVNTPTGTDDRTAFDSMFGKPEE